MVPVPPGGAPIPRHAEPVRPEWIDYNGHMNVAYYLIVLDNATDALFDALGFNEAWRRRTGRSFFAVEGHIRYLGETKLGQTLEVESRLLAADSKRIHYFHTMRVRGSGAIAATFESLLLHVDMATRRAAPFAPEDLARAQAAVAALAALPRPEGAGRAVSMKR
jgi:acyl-CoA thioester hydrolase